jgi:hypothetical protein
MESEIFFLNLLTSGSDAQTIIPPGQRIPRSIWAEKKMKGPFKERLKGKENNKSLNYNLGGIT